MKSPKAITTELLKELRAARDTIRKGKVITGLSHLKEAIFLATKLSELLDQ